LDKFIEKFEEESVKAVNNQEVNIKPKEEVKKSEEVVKQ